MQRSNKWDAPKDVLIVGKRIEHLTECERTPRQYTKLNDSYWMEDIKTSRAKRQRICCEQSVDTDENQQPLGIDIESLSADEIKLKLHELGIQTRLRSLKKLKELLRSTIYNGTM